MFPCSLRRVFLSRALLPEASGGTALEFFTESLCQAGSRAASAARAREAAASRGGEEEGGKEDGGRRRQVHFEFRPYMKAADRAALVLM